MIFSGFPLISLSFPPLTSFRNGDVPRLLHFTPRQVKEPQRTLQMIHAHGRRHTRQGEGAEEVLLPLGHKIFTFFNQGGNPGNTF